VSHVLVVDRDPVFRRFVREQLAQHAGRHVEIQELERLDGFLPGSAAGTDVVLLGADGQNGEFLSNLTALKAEAPVVVVSSNGSLGLAVIAMRAGAADFLVRPIRPEALHDALEHAAAGNNEPIVRSRRIAADFERFIGRSEAMRGVFELISRVAPSKAPVFITGESGTGTELTAEAVHTRSGRGGAFVALNCGAIPRDLMESEIFGHVRGAFTGAQDDRVGAAELADGGTLFLDEICEMAPDLQTKLLRFIQTGTVRRVGDTRMRHVDVRFICATNRTPEAEVAGGRFRADLYYRLHVLPVHLPTLRERPEDILPLAEAALAACASEEGRDFKAFDASARALLLSYEWPGNVRQLQNVVRRVVVMNEGREVSAEMLALALAHASRRDLDDPAEQRPSAGIPGQAAPIEPFEVQERRIIEDALSAFDGNVGAAAAALKISASTIYRKRQVWGSSGAAA
jgi:two-component system repressor protein LuxO